MIHFCKYCGADIKSDQKFCRKCGKKVNRESESQLSKFNTQINKIADLVILLQQGNLNEFNNFYDATNRFVYSCIMNTGIPHYAIEDIMQDTYISIYHNIYSLKEPQSALAWIKKIAFHKSIDYLRKNGNIQSNSIITNTNPVDDSGTSDTFLLPEDIMENKERQRYIINILHNLPSDQKQILIAYYFDECKVDEIAEIMQIPIGTVKTNLYRGRNRVKTAILKLEQESGIKLYSFPIAPILLTIFHQEVCDISLPASVTTNVLTSLQHQLAAYPFKIMPSKQIKENIPSPNTSLQPSNIFSQEKRLHFKSLLAKPLLTFGVTTTIASSSFGIYHYYFSSTPEKTLEQFETAYNDANINKMVDCLDEETQRNYAKINKIANLIGTSPQELLDGILNFGSYVTTDSLPVIDLEINQINYTTSSYAVAECSIDTGSEKIELQLDFMKENHKWHIKFK